MDISGFGSYHDLVDQLATTGMADWVKSQSAGGENATLLRRQEFKSDADKLRTRLKKRRKFLDIRSRYVQIWDMVTTFALVYTATFTPFEVCASIKSQFGVLYGINTVINAIFVADIFVQFFLPVYDPSTKDMIYEHKKLAAR